ncbi:hypothetical protein [Mesorhizobium sp. M0243]|uniref:hypothetical protein n=1 Tax=Mesorhizobium sp. M0243 TaxID=2956925 RepID=UPI00333BED3D
MCRIDDRIAVELVLVLRRAVVRLFPGLVLLQPGGQLFRSRPKPRRRVDEAAFLEMLDKGRTEPGEYSSSRGTDKRRKTPSLIGGRESVSLDDSERPAVYTFFIGFFLYRWRRNCPASMVGFSYWRFGFG